MYLLNSSISFILRERKEGEKGGAVRGLCSLLAPKLFFSPFLDPGTLDTAVAKGGERGHRRRERERKLT